MDKTREMRLRTLANKLKYFGPRTPYPIVMNKGSKAVKELVNEVIRLETELQRARDYTAYLSHVVFDDPSRDTSNVQTFDEYKRNSGKVASQPTVTTWLVCDYHFPNETEVDEMTSEHYQVLRDGEPVLSGIGYSDCVRYVADHMADTDRMLINSNSAYTGAELRKESQSAWWSQSGKTLPAAELINRLRNP